MSYELNSNKIYYDDNKVITLKNTLYSDGFGYESSRYVDNYENLTALTLNHNFAYTYTEIDENGEQREQYGVPVKPEFKDKPFKVDGIIIAEVNFVEYENEQQKLIQSIAGLIEKPIYDVTLNIDILSTLELFRNQITENGIINLDEVVCNLVTNSTQISYAEVYKKYDKFKKLALIYGIEYLIYLESHDNNLWSHILEEVGV